MRIIDADKLRKSIPETTDREDCVLNCDLMGKEYVNMLIDQAPTVDPWHYPSRGEVPDKDWSKHSLNVSKKCFVLTKNGIGTIARWDNDYKTWFENQPQLPVPDVIAWQYFVPPKEEE